MNDGTDDPFVAVTGPSEEEIQQQDFIIEQRLAPERLEKFLADFRENREKTGACASLFDWAGAYRKETAFREDAAYGFNTLLMKGPFVERSNWLSYRTWELATAAERRVLARLAGLLRDRSARHSESVIQATWPTILDSADSLLRNLSQTAQRTRSMVVICGPLESTYDSSVEGRMVPRWDLPDVFDKAYILGMFEGCPILHIREAEPILYVIDIPLLGTLVRYDDYQFDITEVTLSRAEELLERFGDQLVVQPGTPDTREGHLRDLMLKVELKLYESVDFEVSSAPSAGWSVPLAEGTPDVVQ